MAQVAYANCSTVYAEGLRKIRLEIGDVWDAADPFVKAHPELFDVEPTKVNRSTPARNQRVEQATAAPGEKRNR